MSHIIDIVSSIEEPLLTLLRQRIYGIVNETPKGLLFIRLRKVAASDISLRIGTDDLYRVTLCGSGGLPLLGEREFFLYQQTPGGELSLIYIKKD